MKIYKVSFILIFLCASVFSFGQTKKWSVKKDLGHAYRINFPNGELTKGEEKVPTAKGNVMMYSYTLNDDATKNFIYMTSVSDYPESWFPNGLDTFEKENVVLNNCVNGAVTNTKGKLALSRDVKHNGYNGKRIKIHVTIGGSDYTINMQCFLVGYRLYLMQTISSRSEEDNMDTDTFFSSFELLNVRA